MRGRFAPYVVGSGLVALALAALFFAAYAAVASEPHAGFLYTALVSVVLGYPLRRFGSAVGEPTRREALMAVLLLWLIIPAAAAIPFVHSGFFSPLNAYFESMSGFTTTGATVLRDFESFPSTMFMWRALTHWVGGIGIIVIFISVFPQLAIAGRQLFFTEAPGPTEDRLTPRLRNTANNLLVIYAGLTIACIVAYWLAGMTPFEAIAHAFATLAAGGFSTDPLSFEGLAGGAVDWVAVVFMFLAGANFALQYRVLTGKPRLLGRDAEFRAYTAIVLVSTALLTLFLLGSYDLFGAIRHASFQALSIVTTTGFASADFALWPQQAQMILLMLMFIGGSAGSAAGGVKVVRWLILLRHTGREVQRALHPRAVLPVRLGRRAVPEEVLRAVAAFITLYVLLFAVGTAILVVLGSDFITAFTASIACLGNIGPGLARVGPMLNFTEIHPLGRALLIFEMYAGRLEVVTVFVVFTVDWWRLPRRNLWRSRPELP
ncbi:MAG TPA: TrkH family potassium uptake protein [Trueperaceae bacterium]